MELLQRNDEWCQRFVQSDVPFVDLVIKRGQSLAIFTGDKVIVYVYDKNDFSDEQVAKIKTYKHICGDYQSLLNLGIDPAKIELGELMATTQKYEDSQAIICNTENDIFAASEICQSAGIADNKDAKALQNLCKNKKAMVALFRQNGEPCGTARANFVNNKAIIGGVATAKEYRGKGFGKIALQKVLSKIDKDIYLFVCNQIAKNMYKSMGFFTICTWGKVDSW